VIAPISDKAVIARNWHVCSGVSLTSRVRRRRSFSTALAARVSRVEVTPVAISDMLRTKHGATIIPRVRYDPEEVAAPISVCA
jgi:hypothetical protein